MTAAVETMAYAGAVPWHGLGVPVGNDLLPAEMLVKAGIDWNVELRPITYPGKGGKAIQHDTNFMLVRVTDDFPLSVVGKRWKPTQNHEAVEFFDQFVRAGSMKMHTMGSLWSGRYVWALASIEKELKIDKKGKDRIGGFLLMALPHKLGNAMVFKFTSIRVVCWNTYSAALGNLRSSGLDKRDAFTVNHSVKFDDKIKDQARVALGLATKRLDEFGEIAKHLAAIKITEKQADEYFCKVMEFVPEEGEDDEKEPRILEKLRHARIASPGADLATAEGTLWGAFNAITFNFDHEYGHGADTRLKTAWFGQRARIKTKALNVAVDMAKTA